MSDLDQRLKNLNAQLIQVAAKMQKLEQTHVELMNKNKSLQQKIDELSKLKEVNNLTKKGLEEIDSVNIENKDLSKIKNELKKYVADIDKCIEWIQNN